MIDKDIVPPSGDKNDYMSVGLYWWPCNWDNETTEIDSSCDYKTGLPWIQRDGVVNPATVNYDAPRYRGKTALIWSIFQYATI